MLNECPCIDAVERGAGGSKVIYWYHRQFIETARKRYLTGDDVTAQQRKLVHANIAEYFLGTWQGGNPSYQFVWRPN